MAQKRNCQADHAQCLNTGTMAVRTTNPLGGGVKTQVWYDEADAPKTAHRLCQTHGTNLLVELVAALVEEPDLVQAGS